jgi:hypothetical protein
MASPRWEILLGQVVRLVAVAKSPDAVPQRSEVVTVGSSPPASC